MAIKAETLEIYRTAIPMRAFEHAAASRRSAEAVVVRVALSDGRAGVGETLPRPYVTGESCESVVADLTNVIWPAIAGAELAAGELPQLPLSDSRGRSINAAACAAELALADALLDEQAWRRLGGERPGIWPAGRKQRITARVSGVLGSSEAAATRRRLFKLRLFGLRDFKLKLGFPPEIDQANLAAVQRQIGLDVGAGRCSLRVDANGGWSAERTIQMAAELKRLGVCAVEQPVFCRAAELAELARRCELPLIADESLLTAADAEALLEAGPRIWWNIRISKNGGIAASLALARLAARHGVPFVIGCMVGESGILSAAQRRLLALAPPPRFVEGNYGRFLLADDLTRPSLRFGYGGRLKPLRGDGLGVKLDPVKLACHGRLVACLGRDDNR